MVTHIPRRLYAKEHREAHGISAEKMAELLNIERESVYRREREWETRMNGEKQAEYARILGIDPEELWHPPGAVSLDALVADQPEDLKAMAVDIVRRLVAGRR